MADWTDLPDAAVGVGGLPSGTTVTALRDNPIAIAEGAPGAPRVFAKARALEEYTPFTINSDTARSFTGLDPLTVIHFNAVANGGAVGRALEIAASNNGGASYGSWFAIAPLPSNTAVMLFASLNMKTGILDRMHLIVGGGGSAGRDAVNLGRQNINALRFRRSGSGPLIHFMWRPVSRAE